jgi:hypothetical protein
MGGAAWLAAWRISETKLDTDVTLQFDSTAHYFLKAPVTISNPSYASGQLPLTRDDLDGSGVVFADTTVRVRGSSLQCAIFAIFPFCFTKEIDEIRPVEAYCWGLDAQGGHHDLPRDACPAEVTAPLDPPPLPPPS